MLAIAFASLLVGATGLLLCISGLTLAVTPVRSSLATIGRQVARSGAAALAVSACGILAILVSL
jgi:hypothetical protein